MPEDIQRVSLWLICPCCNAVLSSERVRSQLKQRKGGTDDARLIAVVTMTKDQEGRRYRLPVTEDLVVVEGAKKALII